MLMKALVGLLELSTVALVVAAIAMRLRLRRHLRDSNAAFKEELQEMDREQEQEPEQVEH